MTRKLLIGLATALATFGLPAFAQQEVVIGIGVQNTTTNTVTGGVVIKELKLLEKHLPKTGRYKACLLYPSDASDEPTVS